MKKKIKIYSGGVIEPMGYIFGPILTPYMEEESMIVKLLAGNYHVIEVLPDGKEIELTMNNYNRDNTKPEEKPPVRKEKHNDNHKKEDKENHKNNNQENKQEYKSFRVKKKNFNTDETESV